MYTLKAQEGGSLVRGGRACLESHACTSSFLSQPPVDRGSSDIPRNRGRQPGQRGLYSEMTLRGWQLPSSGARGASLSVGPLPRPPPCPEAEVGPGQLEPSTCHDHPDKHFLPCQLTELASLGSCQAPAAGEKSFVLPAPWRETGRRGFQTGVVRVQAEPLALLRADRQAVCSGSLPAGCPRLGEQVRGFEV